MQRGKSYRDEKRLNNMREALELKANQVQRLYGRKFVLQSSGVTKSMVDGQDEEDREDKPKTEYQYRDWREIMLRQQESLRSLISIGVVPHRTERIDSYPARERLSPELNPVDVGDKDS